MSAIDNTVDDEGLTTALRESPFTCSALRESPFTCSPEADIWKEYQDSEIVACARAFLAMARAGHRPLSGDIERHPELLDDPRYLYRDAVEYAQAFLQSRDCDSFWIDQPRRRAAPPLVWAVEAARELAAGGYARAVMLMRMAIEQIEAK